MQYENCRDLGAGWPIEPFSIPPIAISDTALGVSRGLKLWKLLDDGRGPFLKMDRPPKPGLTTGREYDAI